MENSRVLLDLLHSVIMLGFCNLSRCVEGLESMLAYKLYNWVCGFTVYKNGKITTIRGK